MTILRLPAVVKRTGLSKARIYQLERDHRFPARIELGPNSVGWYEHEVDEWCSSRRRRVVPSQDVTQPIGPTV